MRESDSFGFKTHKKWEKIEGESPADPVCCRNGLQRVIPYFLGTQAQEIRTFPPAKCFFQIRTRYRCREKAVAIPQPEQTIIFLP